MTAIRVGANGDVWIAEKAVAAPPDHAAAFGTGWANVGLLTDDGVALTFGKDVKGEKAWGSLYDVIRFITGRSARGVFTMKEGFRKASFLLAMGGGSFTQVAASAGPPAVLAHTRYDPPPAEFLDEKQICVEVRPSPLITTRFFFPRMLVSENVETRSRDDESMGVPITFDVLGDKGVAPFYVRSSDPEWVAA